MARAAFAALLVGGALGFFLGRVSDASAPDGAREAEEPTSARPVEVDRDVDGAHDHDRDTDEAHDHDRDVDEDDEADERAREHARGTRPTPSADELARRAEELTRAQITLERRIADARRERAELFGEPLPPRSLGPRFAAAPIADSLRDALDAEGIEGAIEGVDCSEHPCIAYGRLRGDEEDVEELERSSALDAYRDDRLVLLLWATTASEGNETAETTPETAIFALAFLPTTDDADAHETVERRIRARVFEVWNADRPDREALEPPAI